MKDLLCRAFCDALEIRKVPVGFALTTSFAASDGDPIVVYIVHAEGGRWRLEDDGTQIPMLEANGVDFRKGTRRTAFEHLLRDHEAHFDKESRTVCSALLSTADIGTAALAFATLLLRLQDLALLSATTVRNAFREDAIAAIHQAFEGRAEIEDKGALAEEMIGTGGDIIVRAPEKTPLSIFIGTSEERALHALVTKMDAEKYAGIPAYVALLVEQSKKNPIAERTLGLAWSRLDRVLSFRGTEQIAMSSLIRLIGLTPSPTTEALQ